MLVSIRKSYPGHARKVMSAIWGLGQAMFTKCIVVVDEDVDVQNVSEVAWRALNNIDPERDIQFTMGPDRFARPCQPLVNYGSARWGSTRRGNGRRRLHASLAGSEARVEPQEAGWIPS
jgi:3-polyprenyl-4-hydroxybenzoate decarboxylase